MKLTNIFRGDKTLWVLFLLLGIVSLVEVYSAIGLEASKFASRTPTEFFFRHLLIVAGTWGVVLFLSRVNYRYFSRFAVLALWVSVVLLVVLLALKLSHSDIVAKSGGRWLPVPVIGQFQPSEVAKVALILFMARLMAIRKEGLDEVGTFIQMLLPIVLVVVFVLPTNFSTAALIAISCYLMLYFGGVNRTWWWRLLLIGLVAVVAFLAISYYRYEHSLLADSTPKTEQQLLERSETWGHRVHSWLNPDPEALTQENMARMAIARGGVIGVGPGNTIHARLMTQAHSDFIYAIILEELGLVGGISVFLLYSFFFFRCIRIAWRCRGRFGALTVIGLGSMIYIQALANMAVAVGVLPVTGQTLPFISYGGTAYLFLGCGLGIIQSIAADTDSEKEPLPEPSPEPQVDPPIIP